MTEETEKKKSETITIKKNDLWKYSTIFLAAVVILGLVFGFPGSGSTDANVVADNNNPSNNGANNGLTGPAKYKIYAEDIGLDASDFEECLDSGKYGQATQDDMQYGASMGVQGTPAFFINGKLLSGAQPFAAFQTMIEAELDGSAEAGIDVEIGDSYFNGDENAPVTIIEFSDYECPFCARFAQQTLPSIISNYVDTGKVKMHYRDFPLGFHQNAQKAAEAAKCAGEQNGNEGYFAMHDKIFIEGV
jgi:protein-disulfide isomerase